VSADVRVVAAAFPEILAGRLRSLIAQQSRKKSLRNPFCWALLGRSAGIFRETDRWHFQTPRRFVGKLV